MAKDKGTKPDKKKSKGKDDGGYARPSEAPASGEGWKFETEENVGKLFIITPLRTQQVKTEKYGETEVVVADIVELNEKKPEKSEEHTEVFIFGGWTKGATRGFIGERQVLGRLEQDAKKSKSKTPAWVIEDADDDDIEVALAYKATLDPFGQKGGKGKKGKAEPEKPEKAKKGKGKKK